MARPNKEQAQKLRDQWLLPLTTYCAELAGPSHLAYLKSDKLYRCIDSGNRSGKTTCIQVDCVYKLLGKHPFAPNFPNRRILVIITRSDQAASVWGDRLLKKCGLPGAVGKLPWVDRHYVKKITWQRSQKHGRYPGKIEFINGSEYYMALAGDPDSWLALEGMPFDDIYRDEAAGTTNLSDELEARLWDAQSASERGEKPGAGGVHWGATRTKDNSEHAAFMKRCQSGLSDHGYFYFPSEENASVSQSVREKAKERMSAEAHAVRAMGIGSTVDRVKIYSPCWVKDIHEVRERYRIRPDDNLWIGFDPGWRDKCGILGAAVSRDEPRHLKLIYWSSYKFGGYDHAVQDMKRWLDGRTATRLVCDSQMHASKQDTGETYYTVFDGLLKAHGVKLHSDPLWAKPRIEDSIPSVQKALQNHGHDYDPMWNSITVYTGEQDGDPLTGNPGTAAFVAELLDYRWRVDREGNVLRETVQKNIEAADCLRYMVYQAPQWMDYGEQHALTETVTGLPESPIDPDVALQRQRFAEADRIWAEEGMDMEGQPDQIGVHRW